MERVGDAPDSDMFMDADGSNVEAIMVEYEHALSGLQRVSLQPGQRLSINPVHKMFTDTKSLDIG